jgi:hypothetical protein
MRCIGCGYEMRLVKAVADCTMMVAGYEHQTLECAGCRAVERRMVFGRTIGPLTVEPMRLSSSSPAPAAEPQGNDAIDPAKTCPPKTCPPKTWTRALEKLRNTQSVLKERAAAALASEAIHEFRRTWEGLTRLTPNARAGDKSDGNSDKPESPAAKSPGSRNPGQNPVPKPASGEVTTTEPAAAHTSAVAQVADKLRRRQAALVSGGVDPLAQAQSQPQSFDEMWESFAASPRRPEAVAVKPFTVRPRPLLKSRSLVPLEAHSEVASHLWARAVAMLRGTQEQGREAPTSG